MCVTHLIRYLQCGHCIPDVKANINDRCDAVSAALVFYHDQPSYEPLNEPLILPLTCPVVRPRGHVPHFILQDQVAWDQWMIARFVSNGFGFTQRRDLMDRALGAIQAPPRNIHVPYPANKIRQYDALIIYQNRQNKAPNVVFTTVNGGCGRGSRAACHDQGAPPATAAPSLSPSPHPSPRTEPALHTDERYPTVRKPSSSLPELDSAAMPGDEVRKTSSATGLEQMSDTTAASSPGVLKRVQVEEAEESEESKEVD